MTPPPQKKITLHHLNAPLLHILTDTLTVRRDLEKLYAEGYNSLAIVFVHSYTYPDHELLVGKIARDIGFAQVSMSSQLIPMIKMVPRGVSSTADAYLTPILMDYLDGFFKGFDEKLRRGSGREAKDEREEGTLRGEEGLHDPRVEFMGSDGGLLDLDNFSGLKSILSGPAGGVVGYALTSWDEERQQPIIGCVSLLRSSETLSSMRRRLDVGGTSTDVSRYAGRYETVYETTTAGITIQSPQLDINTVAAGGGSRLFWRNGLFQAGPESAGAEPGPACYRLAFTLLNNPFPSVSCVSANTASLLQQRRSSSRNRRQPAPRPSHPFLLSQHLWQVGKGSFGRGRESTSVCGAGGNDQ